MPSPGASSKHYLQVRSPPPPCPLPTRTAATNTHAHAPPPAAPRRHSHAHCARVAARVEDGPLATVHARPYYRDAGNGQWAVRFVQPRRQWRRLRPEVLPMLPSPGASSKHHLQVRAPTPPLIPIAPPPIRPMCQHEMRVRFAATPTAAPTTVAPVAIPTTRAPTRFPTTKAPSRIPTAAPSFSPDGTAQ